MMLKVGDIVTVKGSGQTNSPYARILKIENIGEESVIHFLLPNGVIDYNTENAFEKRERSCEGFFAIGMEVKINVTSPKGNTEKNGKVGRIVSRFRGGTCRILFENNEIGSFKEIDMVPIRPYGSLEDLKAVEEKYAKIEAENNVPISTPVVVASSPANGSTTSVYKFKKGDIVRIKDTTNLKKRTPNRLNQLGKIVKVPVHPNTWYKVEFENKELDGFRSYSLEFVKNEGDIKTRSKAKEQNFTLFKDDEAPDMRIKITYGSHLNKEGLMIGYAPGYIVIAVTETNENGETVEETIHKRRDHIEPLTESARLYLSRVRNVSEKNKNKKASRAGKSRSRKKIGRLTKPKPSVANPMVAKLLRKKVAVLATGLVGKVVYYDSKNDTYTVRLNENNPYNLKQLALAPNEVDIACKLKLKDTEIMLWEDYKVANDIVEDKDTTQSVATSDEGKYKRRLGEDLPEKEKIKPENLLSKLQKAMKFRRNGVQQHMKYYIERELKAMPDRPDLTRILKKFNHEVSSDLNVFECETAYIDPQLIHSYLPKDNEIIVTLRNISTSSILSQDPKEQPVPNRKDRGKYPLFYNPPLCVFCGMEKFAEKGYCWNKNCKASTLYDPSSTLQPQSSEELVDAYNYNKRFKVNEILSSYIGQKVQKVALKEEIDGVKKIRRNIFGDEVGYFGVGLDVKLPILNQKKENLKFDSALTKKQEFSKNTFEQTWNNWINTVS